MRVGSTPASTARAVDVRTSMRCHDGHTEHVLDVTRPERATVLVDQHGARSELDGAVVDGPPEREIAASYDDQIDVGDLGERNERGMIEPAGITHRRPGIVVERDAERGAGFGQHVVEAGRARREQRQVATDVDHEAVERVGGRLRSGP